MTSVCFLLLCRLVLRCNKGAAADKGHNAGSGDA